MNKVVNFGEWLTTAQVAQVLNCGLHNVRRLIKSGSLQAEKVLDRWLVSRSSLDAYIENPPKPGPKPKGSKPIE